MVHDCQLWRPVCQGREVMTPCISPLWTKTGVPQKLPANGLHISLVTEVYITVAAISHFWQEGFVLLNSCLSVWDIYKLKRVIHHWMSLYSHRHGSHKFFVDRFYFLSLFLYMIIHCIYIYCIFICLLHLREYILSTYF